MRSSRLAALAILGVAFGAQALERPTRLTARQGCHVYRGSVSGNDPSVEFELELCTSPDGRAQGRGQWSSLESGYNVRAIDGAWNAARDGLTLRDVSILEEHPEPGWRFCVIDRYDLRLVDGVSLEGEYHSSACDDHARVRLRLEDAAAPRGGGANAPPTPPSGQAAPGQAPSEPATPTGPSVPVAPPPARRPRDAVRGEGGCGWPW